MDEFKSEDELRPDSSDRRPPRQRKGPTASRVPVSKQHLMIGIGILVLLLLVISIGSALKSPSQPDPARQTPTSKGGERNIDLSGSGSDSSTTTSNATGTADTANGNSVASSPQALNAPSIASTPTEAPPVTAPNGQQRVDVPGNMNDALSQQGGQVNGVAAQMSNQGPASTLPTAPATVASSAKSAVQHPSQAPVKAPGSVRREPKQTPMVPSAGGRQTASAPKAPAASHRTPAATAPAAATTGSSPFSGASTNTSAIQSAPSGYYTLQLSSASQPSTLNAYARKQQLSHAWVYETRRDGKPWYVLVNGVYPSLSQAKSALSQLPADVQAKKPWARQIGQVKKDQNK